MFLQSGTGDVHRGTIWLFFIMLALGAQAAGVIAVAVYASMLLKKIVKATDSFEQRTTPLIQETTALIRELGPKIRSISENVEQVSYTVRAKSDELADTVSQLNRTVQEVNLRSRAQAAKIDGMVSEALETTYDIQQTVQEGIKGPVRQIAGIVAGVKAAVETLVARSPFGKRRVVEDPYDL